MTVTGAHSSQSCVAVTQSDVLLVALCWRWKKAPGRFPQDVAVVARGDTALARTDGLAEREWVELRTRTRPKLVVAAGPRPRRRLPS